MNRHLESARTFLSTHAFPETDWNDPSDVLTSPPENGPFLTPDGRFFCFPTPPNTLYALTYMALFEQELSEIVEASDGEELKERQETLRFLGMPAIFLSHGGVITYEDADGRRFVVRQGEFRLAPAASDDAQTGMRKGPRAHDDKRTFGEWLTGIHDPQIAKLKLTRALLRQLRALELPGLETPPAYKTPVTSYLRDLVFESPDEGKRMIVRPKDPALLVAGGLCALWGYHELVTSDRIPQLYHELVYEDPKTQYRFGLEKSRPDALYPNVLLVK